MGVFVFTIVASLVSLSADDPANAPAAPDTVAPQPPAPAMSPSAEPPPDREVPRRDEPGRGATFRLVVTAALDGLKTGGEAFYGADLFQNGADGPVELDDVEPRALRGGDTLFFADDGAVASADLAAAASAPVEERQPARAFFGPNSIGLARGEDQEATTATVLRRALAAVVRDVVVERRLAGGRVVYALDASPDTPASWPADADAVARLERVVVARGRVASAGGARPVLLFAREKGATARTFGIVDRLLQEPGMPPTGYLDVGGALSSARDTSRETARAVRSLLLARRPAVLAMGRAELGAVAADPSLLADAPYVVAAEWAKGDGPRPEVWRSASVGTSRVAFVALGELGSRARALLPRDARALSSSETATIAGTPDVAGEADFVVGIGVSAEGVEDALSSGNFDAVLSLTGGRVAALAAVDDIDLKENHRHDLHAGPVLVRASAADVGELFVWLDASGRVERIRIVRHAVIDDGDVAEDARAAVAAAARASSDKGGGGLPARSTVTAATGSATGSETMDAWTSADLDRLLGGLVREALAAEITLLPASPRPVRFKGAVPPDLALAWLSQRAAVVTARVRGGDLAKIFDALKRGTLAASVTGADIDARTVAQRPVMPLEWYRVALTREVLAAVERMGVEADASGGASAALDDIVADPVAAGLDIGRVASALGSANGRAVHAFFLDVTDLSAAVSTQSLTGAEPFANVRDARLQAPDSFAWNVDGIVRFSYDGPVTFVSLIGTNHFARLTLDDGEATIDRELRDQALLETEIGLQLARLLQTSPTFIPLPVLRLAYDTEWTPAEVLDDDGDVVGELPRKSQLRGFLGAIVTPVPFLDRVRLGAVVQNDFAAEKEGLDVGAELAFEGNWKLWAARLRVDSFARAFAPDPQNDGDDELGIVSQTIGRLELGLFGDVKVSLFVDGYVASGKLEETRGPAFSVIAGAALGTATRLKLLPFGT